MCCPPFDRWQEATRSLVISGQPVIFFMSLLSFLHIWMGKMINVNHSINGGLHIWSANFLVISNLNYSVVQTNRWPRFKICHQLFFFALIVMQFGRPLLLLPFGCLFLRWICGRKVHAGISWGKCIGIFPCSRFQLEENLYWCFLSNASVIFFNLSLSLFENRWNLLLLSRHLYSLMPLRGVIKLSGKRVLESPFTTVICLELDLSQNV